MNATTDPPPALGDALEERRRRLRAHRVYDAIDSPAALRALAEHHVVCVLDFMSLLKSLVRELSCVEVPWTPKPDPAAARFLLEIVLGEETDVRPDGTVQSHFEWYLEAMAEIGADTGPVRALVAELRAGAPFARALERSALPPASRAFGLATAAVLEAPLHVRAAVFLHGREELLPELFLAILARLEERGLACPLLRAYFERHVQVDGEEHGPRARALLERLYAGDDARRAEGEAAALEALAARERLWDAVAEAARPDAGPSIPRAPAPHHARG